MKIQRDEATATWTLIPVEPGEADTLAALANVMQLSDLMIYDGRDQDPDDEHSLQLNLCFGATPKRQTKKRGRITIHHTDLVGGVKLVLRGSSAADKVEVSEIRDTCFFATSGLQLVSIQSVDSLTTLVVTGKQCPVCGTNMFTVRACSWDICDACADRCAHQYQLMATDGPEGLGYRPCCMTCGRPQPPVPGERQPSIIEQQLAAERELGIEVRYHDFPYTPRGAVQVNRFLRRLRHAQSRPRTSA